MSKKYIIITADTHDADYVTKKSDITDEEIELIKPMIEAIKNCKYEYNYETEEMIEYGEGALKIYKDISNFNIFNKFVPYGEYGIHTIESVEILIVESEQKLI